MDSIELISPNEFESEKYWAHTCEGREKEPLIAHSKLVYDYFLYYCEKKGLNPLILGLATACGCDDAQASCVLTLFANAIYLHDVGKINPCYQYEVLANPSFKRQSTNIGSSHHSLPSSLIYIDLMRNRFGGEMTAQLETLLCGFAFCISRHHAGLSNGHDFKSLDGFELGYYNCLSDTEDFSQDVRTIIQKCEGIADPIAFYILNRLLYALIVACDFSATQEYMTNAKLKISVIENGGAELRKAYMGSEIFKSIAIYAENKATFIGKPINMLRNEIFLEADKTLTDNPDANIYYLEAPTGAGKTNMAINLTLRLLEGGERLDNIFYVFPFNTLVRQTEKILKGYFGDENVKVVNSITPVIDPSKTDTETINFEEVWLDHLFNNYPIVATSHVNFFSALFGSGREQAFPLLKLCNSVVVLDEIQSYKNSIWREIISFLEKYSKLLNIKIIIMSATLPQLDKFPNIKTAKFESLIKNQKLYYENKLFKERVRLDYSLLEKTDFTLEELAATVLKYSDKKVLIEFICKKTARNFYLLIKDSCDAELLTGDDNIARRDKVIAKAKGEKPFILVATQVIEAGVDIDMEVGFKDCSLFDSEEQFLGRINRSCLNPKGGIAFFFNLDDPTKIYRGDARLEFTILDSEIQRYLSDKEFGLIYSRVLERLTARTSRADSKNIGNLMDDCRQLNFCNIEKAMSLIEPNIRLFVACKFESEDGTIIDGNEIWQQFKEISENKALPYAERKVKLSLLSEKMSFFTFSAYHNRIAGAEEYMGYIYIPDGDRFIDKDGILNRDELEHAYGGNFL